MRRILLLLVTAFALSACSSSKENLLRDMNERDANEIIATLFVNQIDSQKMADAKGKTFTVTVHKRDLAKAIAILHANGLPRANRPSLNDIFKPSGFAPTPFEERVRFIYGVSQELERTIAYMQGVLTVRVHIVVPEKVSRRQEANPSSASVFVNYDSKTQFAIQVPAIRKMVAESLEGLKEENIEVLAVPVDVNLAQIKGNAVANVAGVELNSSSVSVITVLAGIVLMLFGFIAYLKRDAIKALYAEFNQKWGR